MFCCNFRPRQQLPSNTFSPCARRLGAWTLAAAAWLIVSTWPARLPAQLQGLWAAAPAVQANGTSVRMPLARPVSRKNKLSLLIDTRWANNYGYRPMEVTVSSPKPSKADRLLTIRVHTSGWGWHTGETSTEQDFELPLGKTAVTTTIACPQYRMDQQYIWWDVWVDGIKDDDLSMEQATAMSTMAGAFSAGGGPGVACLVAGPASRQRNWVAPNTFEFSALSLTLPEFPQRWIEYTSFDVVSLSLSEAKTLAQSNPDAFQALRAWVRAGGQLWISELSEKFEELPEISKLLPLRNSKAQTSIERAGAETAVDREDRPLPAGWRPVRFRRGNPEGPMTFMNLNSGELRVARDPNVIVSLQNDPNFVAADREFEPTEERPRRRWPTDSGRWFLEQRLGLGAVRAFRNVRDAAPKPAGRRNRENETADTTAAEAAMAAAAVVDPATLGMMGATPAADEENTSHLPPPLAMAIRSTRRWELRHGMTPDNPNPDFANLLVPGVGLAPVTEFRVLITLFVLLIGPANYWLLKRFRRLHLLVLTVPLAALVTTASLFAYAILSDGFGTTVRAHSFTTLDQRTGEAACWTRISYYAGLAPGRGLTMPSDVAVYPIIPGWNESSIDAHVGSARELLWESNQAKLTRGWLRSRTPTQYLTIRSRKSPHQIELLSGNGKVRATNKLGATIRWLLVFDQDGSLFAGENLPGEARSNLRPIARDAAIKRLRQLIMEHEPQAPPELAGGDSDFALMQRRQQRSQFRSFGLQYSNAQLSSNLTSDMLAELTGLDGQPALELPPRSYIAVTETGPEVALGTSGAEEEASFHLIVGQW